MSKLRIFLKSQTSLYFCILDVTTYSFHSCHWTEFREICRRSAIPAGQEAVTKVTPTRGDKLLREIARGTNPLYDLGYTIDLCFNFHVSCLSNGLTKQTISRFNFRISWSSLLPIGAITNNWHFGYL